MEIDFLGTCHLHPRGERIVSAFLEHELPKWVGVEADEEYAALTQARQDPDALQSEIATILRSVPGANPDVVRWYLRIIGFEYRAAKAFCDSHRVPLHLIDTYKKKAVLSKQLATRSREALFRMPLEEVMLIGEQPTPRDAPLPPVGNENMMRDAGMEGYVRSLDGRGAVIVGAYHLYGKYHNLFERFPAEECKKFEITEVEAAFDLGLTLAQTLNL